MVEYLEKLGFPDHVIASMDRYKIAISNETDIGMKMTEWWGDISMSFQCKFDEECSYDNPPEKGVPPAKFIVSKNGNGKYTMILKDHEGRAQEWTFVFTGDKVTNVSTYLDYVIIHL